MNYYEEFLVPEDSPEYIERGNEFEILNRIIDRDVPEVRRPYRIERAHGIECGQGCGH